MSPSFEGLSSVARVERLPSQQLDAVYFDTPDHDLAAHHVTLRRRTGGPDAGWHLKLPAGPDARTEVRTPLDGDAAADADNVPDELRDVVLAIVRDQPLAPVARITTNRTVQMLYRPDGAALAEFCDDQVTAWAAQVDGEADDAGVEQRWREWELELAERHRRGVGSAGPADQPAARRRRGARRPRFEVGAGTGKRGRRLHRGGSEGRARRSGAPRSGGAGRRAAGVGSRGARRRLRLGAPDAGDDPQDPQPAAGVRGGVRHLQRRLDSRRIAPACQRARRGPRCRGARRTLRAGARRTAQRIWCGDLSGSAWSTAPNAGTDPGCGGR